MVRLGAEDVCGEKLDEHTCYLEPKHDGEHRCLCNVTFETWG